MAADSSGILEQADYERLADRVGGIRAGDGRISLEELGRTFVVFGADLDRLDDAFPHLDTDGDGDVSQEEYHRIVIDFVASDDPDAPGNWMLGAVDGE